MSATVSGHSPVRVGDVIVHVDGATVNATIDRPNKRNALDYEVIDGLQAAIATAIDREASLLVLRGAGGHFSAGADLALVQTLLDDASALTEYVTRLSHVCDFLATGPFVSLAVVTGYAVAGGCELLLACDLAVAADDAKIGDRHLQNSLLPGAGGSVRLFQRLTPARARRLFYTAEMISGRVAEEWGLVTASCGLQELDTVVDGLIARIVEKAPAALKAIKAMTVAAETSLMHDALAEERRIFVDYATGSDHVREALSRFLEKAPAASADNGSTR